MDYLPQYISVQQIAFGEKGSPQVKKEVQKSKRKPKSEKGSLKVKKEAQKIYLQLDKAMVHGCLVYVYTHVLYQLCDVR